MKLTILLICGIVSTGAWGSEPYDFRGAVLGMPLSQFKAAPFPDAENGYHKHAQLFCSDDGTGRVSHYYEKSLNLVECRYLQNTGFGNIYDPAMMTVGRALANEVLYRFLPATDGEGDPLLFAIDISMNANMFSHLADALSEKLGPSTSKTTRELQNSYGAKFESTTLTWDNEVSEIQMIERTTKLNTMTLKFKHRSVSERYERLREALMGKPKL